ncbi:DNA methyltransferase [Muriicola sp. SD30]|uniref:DNA methyltransferase n=1 Tax=Muriicola sp. SD30 TaxID=3240936 RepID=UPI003510A45E
MKLYSKEIKSLINNDSVSVANQLHLFNINKKDRNGKSIQINDNVYRPIKALGHTPPYKIHKYFARRPWNVFSEIIKSFSNENEIVLDPFCGGGVTLYEGLKLNRKVLGFDLNPLSVFIINNMVSKGENIKLLFERFSSIIEKVGHLYEDYYFFENDGQRIFIDWIETTFKVICPECKKETLLSNELRNKPGFYSCLNPSCENNSKQEKGFAQRRSKRIGHVYLYLVGFDSNNQKIVYKPLKKDLKRLNQHILFLESIITQNKIDVSKDLIPKNWDRQKEDTLEEKGIVHFQDLFTQRNLLINNILLFYINEEKKNLPKSDYELLRIAFSNTVKETNIMSFTNDTWQGGKPTTWSKHAYWIPSQFCEVNILSAFIKSLKRVKDSLSYNNKFDYQLKKTNDFNDLSDSSNFLLINNSIALSDLPENSIDSIITDPPYGSNVQYLELSHFWYVWNKDIYDSQPDFTLEAISNRKKGFKGAKSMYTYEDNLYSVFSKCYEVLKPNKHMILTFNNKDISAWLSLLFSIFRSGFTLAENGIYFQDGVDNYKQTAHTRFDGSPYGDFIYVFKKSTAEGLRHYESEESFSNELDELYHKFSNIEEVSKYDWLMEFFNSSLPLIEGFSKSYLQNNKHSLFSRFNKSYLKKVY